MTLNYCFNFRNLILTAALIGGLSLVTHATAEGPPFFVDLNSRTVTPIGTSGGDSASGINDAGQVVGALKLTAAGNTHAFITGPDGMGMRDLGTLGGDSSAASDINDAGQVVGFSHTAGGAGHAFITGPNGMGMRDLGDFGSVFIDVLGINDAGQMVGNVVVAINRYAFITGPDGMGIRDLGTLGGDFSEVTGINDAGQVVGLSDTAEASLHAFITGPNGMGMRDLGTLGGRFSSALGINDAGQVVGESMTSTGAVHAFITGPDGMGMIDLNSLVDLPQGVPLIRANGINNEGQIIATAVPEPETYALMLAGLALVGFSARRKKMASSKTFLRK